MSQMNTWYSGDSTGYQITTAGYGTTSGINRSLSPYHIFAASIALASTIYIAHGYFTLNNKRVSNFEDPFSSSLDLFNEKPQTQSKSTFDRNSYTDLSKKLMIEFGFKKANWAKILRIERKTLYNWENSPNTKIQSSTSKRLDALLSLREEMDADQRKFLSVFTFGRRSDPNLLESLLSREINPEDLINHYYRLYNDFQGISTRTRMGVE